MLSMTLPSLREEPAVAPALGANEPVGRASENPGAGCLGSSLEGSSSVTPAPLPGVQNVSGSGPFCASQSPGIPSPQSLRA